MEKPLFKEEKKMKKRKIELIATNRNLKRHNQERNRLSKFKCLKILNYIENKTPSNLTSSFCFCF